ncbi:meiotic recombination protein SPO11 [Geosmithia morbida]|uniref:DNA topoisomerase (ATP-hydrolyzing) n=1 Tax=Geosmithia morbida TaxID=1094350 RepID=A0A9P5D2E8_9HYPO|nr:meiotic recombination protein SPO11 [Geosmithia morbida]KAF4120740.1 meiotic recombination protein SPO11 [Geosmithia morbida]
MDQHNVLASSHAKSIANVRPAGSHTGALIIQIEGIIESILDDVTADRELTIDFISSPRRYSDSLGGPTKRQSNLVSVMLLRVLIMINHREANSYLSHAVARVLFILQLCHDALVADEILTKRYSLTHIRHIFYQNQALFGKQSCVDILVECLALTLGTCREELNIVASSKGLFSGPITLRLRDSSFVNGSWAESGTVIPVSMSIRSIDTSQIKWVLVVEKDAKGYPDDSTRSFLQLINEHDALLPILVLVDYDPDGLNIFQCYRFGSTRWNSNGNAGVNWLGIKTEQTLHLGARLSSHSSDPAYSSAEYENECSQAISSNLPYSMSSLACRGPVTHLTERDRRLAYSMLKRLSMFHAQDTEALELRRELQIILCLGVKAEIQWLDESGSIAKWLEHEISDALSQW